MEKKRFAVGHEQTDTRLDRFLASHLREFSRSRLASLIRGDAVQINDMPIDRPSFQVEAGQVITVDLPPPAPSGKLVPADIPLSIVYQDEDIAVVDKPAGLVVHPAAGHRQDTLVNALLHHLADLSGIGGELRPGILHRLDKDTSGLIVVAKNDAAHRELAKAWGTDRVVKEYLAIVYGTPRDDQGTIEAPIGRDPRNRKRMAVVPGGRLAITHWNLEMRLRHVALLRCLLETGRTHQIRVHLKSIGHPVIADSLYSGPQWKGIPDKKLKRAIGKLDRQALHATRVTFPHPSSDELVSFESPLPEELAAILDLAS